MMELAINSVGSYFDIKVLDNNSKHIVTINDHEKFFDLNKLFWEIHFSENKIQFLVDFLIDVYPNNSCNIPEYERIIQNSELFVNQVKSSLRVLDQLGVSNEEHFNARETLTILCSIYSELEYNPFKLSVEGGFELNDFSSDLILENCLNYEVNPYYNFLVEFALPEISKVKPEILFLRGKINFSSLTLAVLVKNLIPECYIAITRHSTEYFSLNNISDLLKQNKKLFTIIDSIILDDFKYTEKRLSENFKRGKNLSEVPNLLWVNGNEIIQNPYEITELTLDSISKVVRKENNNYISNSEVLTLKLWPEARCYWNKCKYCNINSKYKTLPESNEFTKINEKVFFFEKAVEVGYRFLNFIDEAVPPHALNNLAIELKNKSVSKLYWSIRSRIDKGFTNEVCNMLAKSGLRSIYFGLESANSRVLKLMNKFDSDFSLDFAEEIVRNFNFVGVNVHFCFIVGFPGETDSERKETYNFIEYLISKYNNFTFAINVFHFMIGSELYLNAERNNMQPIFPCNSESFLENMLLWEIPENNFVLDKEKYEFLAKTSFSWVPKDAMTSFWSLAITSKLNALIRELKKDYSNYSYNNPVI